MSSHDKNAKLLLWALLSFALIVIVRSAWVCDDAYITFRTVSNLVSGHGLTWNAGERVQSYSHPLWMLILVPTHWLFRDFYSTSMILQIVLTLLTLWVVHTRLASSPILAILATAALLMSKSFVDYSTSGLENPLSHLTLAAFFAVLFSGDAGGRRYILLLATTFSLVVLTRMDNALLVFPPLVYSLVRQFQGSRLVTVARGLLSPLLLGFVPLLLWELFSLLYYGFPLPNTAYAKIDTQIPFVECVEQGIFYLTNSLRIDPLTMTLIIIAVVHSVIGGDTKRIAISTGIVLYILYVVRIGGDFMSGRFLTTPLLSAVVLLATFKPTNEKRFALFVGAIVLLVSLAASFPTLSNSYRDHAGNIKDGNGITDARMELYRHSGFLTSKRYKWPPRHKWVNRGIRFRQDEESVEENVEEKVRKIGGTGFTGYYAGPDVYILDLWSLSDPLLARLPYYRSDPNKKWRPGHIWRGIPAGYTETLETGANKIRDKDLAAYYEKIRIITRGRLSSFERLRVIAAMNLGMYDHLLDAYVERVRLGSIEHDEPNYKSKH